MSEKTPEELKEIIAKAEAELKSKGEPKKSKSSKNKIIIGIIAAVVIIIGGVFGGIAIANHNAKVAADKAKHYYADKDFVKAVERGLEKRWDIQDAKDNKTDTTEQYKKGIQAELDSVQKFKDEKFKDAKLQALALDYITQLKAEQGIVKYYNVDIVKFNDLLGPIHDQRTKDIQTLVKNYDLKVDKKYQSILDDLLTNAQEATTKDALKEKVTTMANSIKFVYTPQEYDDQWKKYTATVENTTGQDLKSFNLQINLEDAAGTTLDSTYVNANNWKAGTKVQLEFTTDKQFVKTVYTPDYDVSQ